MTASVPSYLREWHVEVEVQGQDNPRDEHHEHRVGRVLKVRLAAVRGCTAKIGTGVAYGGEGDGRYARDLCC